MLVPVKSHHDATVLCWFLEYFHKYLWWDAIGCICKNILWWLCIQIKLYVYSICLTEFLSGIIKFVTLTFWGLYDCVFICYSWILLEQKRHGHQNTHSLSGSGCLARGVSVLDGCRCQVLLLLRHSISYYGARVSWLSGN